MKISLIVPCYNEEVAIPDFYRAVRDCKDSEGIDVEIIFINDGSSDATEEIISKYAKMDPLVFPISFTRNFGKEAALCAGIDHCSGDAAIPIDVDLQDPIEVIPKMIEKWKAGADVVLAKRVNRASDTFLKRKTADLFYKLYSAIATPKIEPNVGDFRLLDRKVLENIKKLQERNIFMKGLLSWVGGDNVEIVEYVRAPRRRGNTKFNFFKLTTLAIEGITSFSILPLKIWTFIGCIISFFAFAWGLKVVFEKVMYGNPISGYPSLMVSILFLCGIQLIGIGILGEYIGRIYIETKQRPRYIMKELKKEDQKLSDLAS